MSGPHGEHFLTDEDRRAIRERYREEREREGEKDEDEMIGRGDVKTGGNQKD